MGKRDRRDELTGKQRAFVRAWFNCNFNATEAAAQAGYSGDRNTLASVGSQNLRKRKIQRAIDEAWQANGISSSEILAHLAEIARFDAGQVMHENGSIAGNRLPNVGRIVRKVDTADVYDAEGNPTGEVRVKSVEFYDRLRALELLGRAMGIFKDAAEAEDLVVIIDR